MVNKEDINARRVSLVTSLMDMELKLAWNLSSIPLVRVRVPGHWDFAQTPK